MTKLQFVTKSVLPMLVVGMITLACKKQASDQPTPAPASAMPAKMVPQEDADAEFKQGLMYLHGIGTAQYPKQAAEWFKKAADKGHALAQYNLGAMYGWGYGITSDKGQAKAWLEKAAAQGVTKAQVNLGLIYAWGEGVVKDINEAKKWFQIAADKGDAEASAILERLKKDEKHLPVCPSLPKAKLCGPVTLADAD